MSKFIVYGENMKICQNTISVHKFSLYDQSIGNCWTNIFLCSNSLYMVKISKISYYNILNGKISLVEFQHKKSINSSIICISSIFAPFKLFKHSILTSYIHHLTHIKVLQVLICVYCVSAYTHWYSVHIIRDRQRVPFYFLN